MVSLLQMTKPITLTNKAIIDKARATLKRLDADTFKQWDAARIRARAWGNVAKGQRYARLQREARLEARRALHAAWKAFAAYDRFSGLSPSRLEREQRELIETTLKKMAGLT